MIGLLRIPCSEVVSGIPLPDRSIATPYPTRMAIGAVMGVRIRVSIAEVCEISVSPVMYRIGTPVISSSSHCLARKARHAPTTIRPYSMA